MSLHPQLLHLPNFFLQIAAFCFPCRFLFASTLLRSDCLRRFLELLSISSCRLARATRYTGPTTRRLFLLGFHSVDRSFAHNGYRITRGWSSSPLANALLYPLARLLIRALIKFTMVNERTERMKRARKKEGKWKRRRWNVVRFFRMS